VISFDIFLFFWWGFFSIFSIILRVEYTTRRRSLPYFNIYRKEDDDNTVGCDLSSAGERREKKAAETKKKNWISSNRKRGHT
jgi:hypothetical protein